jgi:hypothetical protein
MTIRFTLLFLLVFSCRYVSSQEIKILVEDVREERRSGFNKSRSLLELQIRVNGINVDDFNQIRILNITKAIDDKGNSLKRLKDLLYDGKFKSDNKLSIRLEAPSRESTKLELLEGVIECFVPSENKNSKVVINNLLEKYNQNLLQMVSNSKLTLINRERLRNLKEKDSEEYNKKIEEIKKIGDLGEEAETNLDRFKSLFDDFSKFDDLKDKKSLAFYFEGDRDEIVDIIVYNDTGQKMNTGSTRYGSKKMKMIVKLRKEPQINWRIEILLRNKESVKELKFSVADIFLP